MDCPRCDALETDLLMATEAARHLRHELMTEREARVNAERRADLYFRELSSLRRLLENERRFACEGYIWGEPA
jgi:hypothetical protein